MSDETPPASWLDGDAAEPKWEKGATPKTHLCEGCDTERPADGFAVVDSVFGGEYLPLVRCDNCRAKTAYQVYQERLANQDPIEHTSNCNVNPKYSQDPATWARGCDCGATSRAAERRKGGSAIHYHLDVTGPNEKDGKRVGALTTTRSAAEQEKRIEEEGVAGRRADIRECTKNCFGQRLSAA